MRASLIWALQLFDLGIVGYFIVINTCYLLFSIVAFVELRRHRRKWTSGELGTVMRSPATPAISVIVPAHNHAATIQESVRAFLHLNFPQFEVVVVNDGSADSTLATAVKAFDLMHAPIGPQQLDTKPVRGVYRSLTNLDVVVVDKDHGGRADAINAGINAARYPLICVVEANSLLEDDTLARAVLPFVEDATTVAAGGIIRIANGCRVEQRRITEVGLPANRLAMFQVVEQLRAFLAARVAQSVFGGLLNLSGAFGVFRRDLVIEAGGFRCDTTGDDMDIVTRLHRICRSRGTPYRIVFQPEPVCWIDAPETVGALAAQRSRWQRGTMQSLGVHAQLVFNARYGVIGLLALPYTLVVEAAGPLVELLGYAVTIVAVLLGLLDWRFAKLVFLSAVLYGIIVSLAAVVLQELSSRRYPRAADLIRLAAYAVFENFGYRQLAAWWRVRGMIELLGSRQGGG